MPVVTERIDQASTNATQWVHELAVGDLDYWCMFILRSRCGSCNPSGDRCMNCLTKVAHALRNVGFDVEAQYLAEMQSGRQWLKTALLEMSKRQEDW